MILNVRNIIVHSFLFIAVVLKLWYTEDYKGVREKSQDDRTESK